MLSIRPLPSIQRGVTLAVSLAWLALPAHALPNLAQGESYLWGPGTSVGPATEVEADCKPNLDGSVTCNTKLVNPPGDTPAKPSYQQFGN